MSVLLEFAMFPTDKGESVSEHVSEIIKAIRDNDVDYQLTPMGTIIETENLAEALAIVETSYAILESSGCSRVYSSLKLDIRLGENKRLTGKLDSIRDKIGDVST